MKILPILIGFLFINLSLIGQSTNDCSTCSKYQSFLKEGKKHLSNNDFDKALIEFQAAQVAARVCDCSTTEPASLIQKAIEGIQDQKEKAIKSAKEANRQKRAAQKAAKLAEERRIVAQEATEKAEKAAYQAERSSRANQNALTALELGKEDPTKALRLAEMNYLLFPTSESAAGILKELLERIPAVYKNFVKGHTSYVNSVAFSPDGKSILTGSLDQSAKLWDLQGNEIQSFLGHTSDVFSVAFSPDGKSIFSASIPDFNSDLSGKIMQSPTPWLFFDQKAQAFSIGALKVMGLRYTNQDLEEMRKNGGRWGGGE